MVVLLAVALALLFSQAEAALPLAINDQARHTVDLIYNMEFDAALQAAQEISQVVPHHPAGYFYRAATYWQWRLIVHNPSQRTELLTQFNASMQQAIDIAEQLPPSQEAEAALYLGAAYGMQARMYVVEKHYFKAMRVAKKGGAYLQHCVNLDPTLYDAQLGLGLYHYAIAQAPALVRGVVQWLVGLKGDRVKGLQELEQARTQSLLASPEATSVLATLYASSHEKQYDKAYRLLQQLVQNYPNNFDYRFRLLFVSARLGYWEQARQLSRDLMADVEQEKPYTLRQWLPLLSYRIAETYVMQGNATAARPLLYQLQSQDIEAPLRAWVTLRLGNTDDLRSNHQTAQKAYQRVEGDESAQQLADQYTTTPFDLTQTEVKPPDQVI